LVLFAWPTDQSLTKLGVEADLVRKVAADLQSALGREKQAKATNAETKKRQKELKREIAKLRSRIDRLSEARSVRAALQKNHSLHSAMKTVLQQNRKGIELIFSRIHSPAEFVGLGSNWTTLYQRR
jgi:ATP phosphoribosyltransferase regulatory subunit HisZ